QRRVYDAVARPLLDHAFDGYNVCLFAYGQTGSGKSYTMMGSPTTGHAGVIPRAAAHLFDSIRDRSAADPNIAFNVQASYLEIYMERVRDLLNPGNKEKLRVREHPILGPYVESLSKLILRSDDEVQRVLADGDAVRTVAATKMNDVSSRSHAVFQLILTQTRFDPETRLSTERVSRLSFVDLAGSERANSTGASGVTLREGALINKSLTSLGKVISALADLGGSGGAAGTHVPYRDSVLTWLLKDSLGGNSKTHMISCISPAAINANESLSTLRYSDRAKRIVNQAKVNEDPNAKLIADLKAEIAELRRQLGGTAPGSNVDAGAGVSGDMLQPGAESQLKDQLRSSEKLMLELNETWEEKLRRTQEIYAAKDRILADLGIRVGDGHVGITSPRRHPHLLNQHPNSLSESLVYTLPPGKTDLGSDNKCGIKLDALRPTHAAIYNADRIVLLQPLAGARDVQVNGRCIEKTTILQSGDNVRIATYQFRFVHPRRAAA
ncbi:P-loop containing nucleoside triphosphate hydrolase protein, partial [Blastocladiella britannica]